MRRSREKCKEVERKEQILEIDNLNLIVIDIYVCRNLIMGSAHLNGKKREGLCGRRNLD